MIAYRITAAVSALGLLIHPVSASAQDPKPPGAQAGRILINAGSTAAGGAAPAPGLIAPTAFSRGGGKFAVGFGLESQTRAHALPDGAMTLSAGFGNQRSLAADLNVNIFSLGVHEPFAQRGSVSAKVNHLLRRDTAVAIGTRSGAIWGGSDAPSELYSVLSHVTRVKIGDVRYPVYLNAGATYLWTSSMNGIYHAQANDVIHRYGRAQGIAGVGIRVSQPMSIFMEWTGEDLDLGISIVPIRNLPLVLTPTVADLTGRSPRSPRFLLGLGLPFST